MNVGIYGKKVTKQTIEVYNEFLGILKDFGYEAAEAENANELSGGGFGFEDGLQLRRRLRRCGGLVFEA